MNDLSPENISNISNNSLIEKALVNVKSIKKGYEKELAANYSSELLDKIIAVNKIIDNAEKVMVMTAKEGHDYYRDNYPKSVDSEGKINDKGITRLNFLNRKWFKFKNNH